MACTAVVSRAIREFSVSFPTNSVKTIEQRTVILEAPVLAAAMVVATALLGRKTTGRLLPEVGSVMFQ